MKSNEFRTDAVLPVPHCSGCSCALHSRRLFGAALLAAGASASLPAAAQQAVPPSQPVPGADIGLRGDVGKESRFTKLVPAEQVEQAAAQQYAQHPQRSGRIERAQIAFLCEAIWLSIHSNVYIVEDELAVAGQVGVTDAPRGAEREAWREGSSAVPGRHRIRTSVRALLPRS